MNSTLESAVACLRDAQAEIGREYELDETTNTFAKPLPQWAAVVRDLIHAAQNHLENAKS